MAQSMKIAIVDDEQDMRRSISQWLSLSGFDTETFASAEDALKNIGADYPGVVVSDIRMPGMDGMQFLKRLMGVDSSLPVIMITGHGDVPMAVEAMRVGAFDFLEKPFNPDRMTELAKAATRKRRLALDSRALRRELSDGTTIMKKLIGSSPAMERLREDILDLGQADGHVLIDGETGSGKTLVAHALHAVSSRAGKSFVILSCGMYEDEVLSQKLFTGDHSSRRYEGKLTWNIANQHQIQGQYTKDDRTALRTDFSFSATPKAASFPRWRPRGAVRWSSRTSRRCPSRSRRGC